MADPDLGLTGAEGGDMGQPKSRHFGDIKARFKVDDEGLKTLNKQFVTLNDESAKFHRRLPRLTADTKKWADQLERAAQAMGGLSGNTGVSGYSNANAKVTQSIAQGQAAPGTGVNLPMAPGITGGGGGGTWAKMKGLWGAAGGPLTAGALGASVVGGVGAAVGAMDRRIQGAASNMLSMDQIGLLYTQASPGLTQLGYQSQYRNPLAGFRLGGVQGTNELLRMQAFTGLQSQLQAGGIEAMRQSTGWALTTQQGASLVQQLASPEANNRMTMMLGTGLVGPGGRERPVEQVVQDIIQRTGLTDRARAQDALRPGSRMRARLRESGVPEEMIDLVLLRATQQGPGGGALNQAAVEGSYATEVEDTMTATGRREEDFYRRQIDNYKQLEEQTQNLIQAFGALEDQLSGIIGAGATTSPWRGSVFGNVAKKVAGGAMMAGGLFLTGATFGGATPIGLGLAAGGAALATGDAVGSDGGTGSSASSTAAAGSGTGTNNVTPAIPPNLQKHVGTESWQKLHARMKEKLIRMFTANPKLDFGNGYRSTQRQTELFLSRHVEDPNGRTRWNGKRWTRVRGPATAAPGSSMHEIGLAADLAPESQYGWIVANASKFGLQVGTSFGEAWHVQPAELPMGRSTYEAQGAIWGTTPGGSEGGDEPALPGEENTVVPEEEPTSGMGGGGMFVTGQQSMSDTIQALFTMNQGMIGAGGFGGGGGSVSSGQAQGEVIAATAGPTNYASGAQLTGEQVAKVAAATGLRGQALQTAIAIARGESTWNAGALNPVGRDYSVGLWQINMLAHGNRFGSEQQLYDPQTNAQAMHALSGGGENWRPWSVYTSGEYRDYMSMAQSAMTAAGVGDAVVDPYTSGGSGRSVTVHGGNQITIAPQITIQGGASVADAHAIAREVISILNTSEAVKALRRS